MIRMKTTGIVRRVDDLGRVIIPKEIRRNLGIKEGDPLELLVENNRIIFQKQETEDIADSLFSIVDSLKEKDEHPDFQTILASIAYSLRNPD